MSAHNRAAACRSWGIGRGQEGTIVLAEGDTLTEQFPFDEMMAIQPGTSSRMETVSYAQGASYAPAHRNHSLPSDSLSSLTEWIGKQKEIDFRIANIHAFPLR